MDDSTHSTSPHHVNVQGARRAVPSIHGGAIPLVAKETIEIPDTADYVGVFTAAINWPAVRHAYDGVRP